MNRDWFALTAAETRGRVRLCLEWYPHVVVDLHEMGGDSTYYFAPPAEPRQPAHHPRAAGVARALRPGDRRPLRRARLRLLRPRGLRLVLPRLRRVVAALPRRDRDDLRAGLGPRPRLPARGRHRAHLPRRASHNHFPAALATVETAAREREKLLRDFLDFRRSAVAEGEAGPVREYVLVPGADRARLDRLAELLVGQGIEVRGGRRASCGAARARFPAGSFVVPLAQPAGRLVRNLLDPRVSMDEAFVKEQERRRQEAAARRDLRRDGLEPARSSSTSSAWARAALAGETRAFAPGGGRRRRRPRRGEGGVAAAVGLGHGGGRGRGACRRA